MPTALRFPAYPALPRPKTLLILVFISTLEVTGVLQSAASDGIPSATLSELFKGMETCSVQRDALRFKPGRNAEYLRVMSRGKPYRVANGVAWFRVRDTYRGLPVQAIAVPAHGGDSYGLVFGASPAEAGTRLAANGFTSVNQNSSAPTAHGGPGLFSMAHSGKASILVCSGTAESAGPLTEDYPLDYMIANDGLGWTGKTKNDQAVRKPPLSLRGSAGVTAPTD